MLSTLLGSKNAERVLLFLLVNESCYASEVQKAFHIPLTPLQSIIAKLEKAGILTLEKVGKTKLCRLNPDYPLHHELKALLKTAFVHLPAEEKRSLFHRREKWTTPAFQKEKKAALCLEAFWQRLQKVKQMSIQSHSGQAFGKVAMTKENDRTLIFTEKGQWVNQPSQDLDFNAVLRWSIDFTAGVIGLEHLHYGSSRPVFLFHLAPTGPKTLQSIDSHFCLSDCYFGRIEFNQQHIRFLWRILGPKKNEVLYHIYS